MTPAAASSAPKLATFPDGGSQGQDAWMVATFGRRGMGKTYLLCRLCEAWAARKDAPLIAAVDPVCPDGDDDRYIAHYSDVWWPELPAELKQLKGAGLVVIDEADRQLPQKAPSRWHPLAVDLVRRGRHRGICLALASQRPSMLAYDVWSLADRIYIFQTVGAVDERRLLDLDPRLKPYRKYFSRLRTGQCIVWDGKTGIWPPIEVVRDTIEAAEQKAAAGRKTV